MKRGGNRNKREKEGKKQCLWHKFHISYKKVQFLPNRYYETY